MMNKEEKIQLKNVIESIKFKMNAENLSFEVLFTRKDFLSNGYLKYGEIRSILEKEIGLFHPNFSVLQVALADDDDKISLKTFEKLLNNK